MRRSRNGSEGEAQERAFAARLAELWQPPRLTPAGRAAFDAGLDAKLAGRRRRRAAIPALAAATAAAAVAWVLLPGSPSTPVGEVVQAGAASWEYDLIYDSGDSGGSAGSGGSEMLPDDYQAIASLLLDG
jgi:hypothetical protein